MIYSKFENGKHELYERVPGGEDTKLTYVDETGATITLAEKDTYRCAPKATIKRDSDGKQVNCMSGDVCVIGNKEITPKKEDVPKPSESTPESEEQQEPKNEDITE